MSCKWEPKNFFRVLVIMNADGSPGIDANIRLGSRIPIFVAIPFPLLFFGSLLGIIGIIIILWARRL
jgi:hypothetical protein